MDEGSAVPPPQTPPGPEPQLRALETVLLLAEAVATSRSLEELAERAVEAIQAYTGAPGVCIWQYDEPRRAFHPLAHQGFDLSRYPATLPMERSLTGLAATRGHTITTSDIDADGRLDTGAAASLSRDGFGEAAVVPILSQGQVVASLNLFYPAGTRLSPEEQRILEAMAGTVGVALAHREATARQQQLEEQAQRAQRLESLGLLAGGIAHDFNNLLVGILGNVDLAREEAAAAGLPETVELLDDALRAADRARGLVRQLLTFSRGGAPVKQAVASLPTVVRDAALFALRGTSVRCEPAVDGELGVIELDPVQVAQVVQNLVQNAAQASAPGASVTVRLDRRVLEAPEPPLAAGVWVRLRVGDQGRGIAPDDLARIFEPFFSRRPGGTGLGLAVCHSIVRRHGGQIQVESTPGRGTTFTVHLPAGRAAPVAEVRVEPSRPLGGRALVMDDEAQVRAVARRMLERQGFEVVECREGMEALGAVQAAAAAGGPFHVALLDVTVVGGAGGLEIARALRVASPATRIVISSGYDPGGALRDPAAVGADAQLEKPYTSERLAAVLSRLLGPKISGG